MIQLLYNLIQPMAVVIFILSGILCIVLKKWHACAINFSIAWTNFVIFYGGKFLNNGN